MAKCAAFPRREIRPFRLSHVDWPVGFTEPFSHGLDSPMKQEQRPVHRNPPGYGFDYGIGITAAAVGSLEFNKNLMDAEVVAVAYGLDFSRTLGIQVPTITLVGQNEAPLRKAFEEFATWAKSTDGDAVELTIVFTKNGGYRLCINPEVGALYKRALQYDTVVNPLAFQVTWIKVINTVSQPLLDLREYLSAGTIRPFLLCAARYSGILLRDTGPLPELIEPIAHEDELLKFEIKFVDEGSADDLLWQRIALVDESHERKTSVADSTVPPSFVWNRRKEAIKRLFPVTLWKSKSCQTATDLRRSAEGQGLREWQIDQAICNLTLSLELTGGSLYFRGISRKTLHDEIWEALRNRFEVAGSDQQHFEQCTAANIVRQTLLDAKALLRNYETQRTPNSLKRTQHFLQKHRLLDRPDT